MNPDRLTHADLVKAGATWLRTKKRCKVVLAECGSFSWGEIPDVIGFLPNGASLLLEAKVSISDLQAQFRKPSAEHRGMGRYRWFLTPPGLVPSAQRALYTRRWGLLEAKPVGRGYRITEVVPSSHDEWNGQAEAALLCAELSRLGIVAGNAPGRRVGMQGLSVKPVELPLACPACGEWHIETGQCPPPHFVDRSAAHRKHWCSKCGTRWTPTEMFPTVGIRPRTTVNP